MPGPSGRSDPHRAFRLEPFRAAPWIPGPHGHTVLGKALRPPPPGDPERLRLTTPDGDFLDVDLGPDPGGNAPLVLVLHGLEGSSRRAYVGTAVRELLRQGLRAAAMNFRSCSGEPNRRPRFYHSGDTGDLAFVLEVLRKRFPGRPIGAVGFSLGGNVLLKYLGEAGGGDRDGTGGLLGGAAAISVPFDLSAGARRIEGGMMGPVYTRYFLRSLRRKILAKRALLEPLLDLERVLGARTLREYDEAATAPLHGFPGAETYYRESSSLGFLPRIRVPTLLVQAGDDPFLPPGSLPVEAVEANPWLLPAFTPTGGHVGFVEGTRPWRPRFWAEAQAARYLGHLLGRGG